MHHTTSLIAARRHRPLDSARGAVRADLLKRIALGMGAVLIIGLLGWALSQLAKGKGDAPKRQVAKIALLPDTPPPPPPPPPKERKEELPKNEPRPQPTPDNTPKPPVDAAIKMEGAAGNGPSAFQAGSVSKEYAGGAPVVGGAASSAGGVDRAAERLYAGTVRQMLRDEIERQLSPDAGEIQASFAVWVAGDGRISRWELDQAEGQSAPSSAALDKALARSAESLRLPSPKAYAQPMRFRLTLRANG